MINNNKIYINFSIFAGVALLFVIFIIWPLFSGIEKESEDLISAKDNIASLKAQTVETGKFGKDYQNYNANLNKISQMFVDPNNPVDFIEFLESADQEAQITSQISMSPADKANQFIIFQISSKGSFSGFLKFSEILEAGPYLLEIENMNIQNLDKNVSASFVIKVFTKK
ncbi:MAG: hypothetical protein NTW11_01735 [Candidatus Staskawiczbacteria bacterium]|nr:hypothetical protein [Candidatus Staskawiczbacteria bacterium]